MSKNVKPVKMAPFEKILNLMVTGEPMTKEEIGATLGDEIQIYRISTYMWHIKMNANGIVRVIKDGRKVLAYQLVNPADIVKYLKDKGIYFAGDADTQPVQKLEDLKAEPQVEVQPIVTETVAKTEDTLEVTEIVDEVKA
jgi:hypothetical protein